jgi:hypothetical protein
MLNVYIRYVLIMTSLMMYVIRYQCLNLLRDYRFFSSVSLTEIDRLENSFQRNV